MRYAKIDFYIKENRPYPKIGATLRGVLGYSLQNLQKNPKHQNSVYNTLYVQEVPFKDFRIAYELVDEEFIFSVYLFNEMSEPKNVHEVVKAMKYGIEVRGLKKARISYSVENIVVNGEEFDTEASALFLDPVIPESFFDVDLYFLSPLMIKKDKEEFVKDIKLENVLSSIYRKMCYFFNEPMTPLPFSPSYEVVNEFTTVESVVRRSTSQKKKIELDGIVGFKSFKNVDPKSLSILKVGEVLGVGAKTTHGFGTIKIEEEAVK